MCAHHRRRFGLVALVLTGVLASTSVAAAELDPYLPDDTVLVVSVNIHQILDAALVKKYLMPEAEKNLNRNGDTKKILELLGLNPFKDLSSVTFASPGSADNKKVPGLIIVRGHFDSAKIQSAADQFASSNPTKLLVHKLDD